jgi:6-phosphogluconate dehydrogenase
MHLNRFSVHPVFLAFEPVFAINCLRRVVQGISAKADGEPCCDWVGEDGAGHFVKMVHNGIEYGDMQLICEAYQLMRDGMGMSNDEMSKVRRLSDFNIL